MATLKRSILKLIYLGLLFTWFSWQAICQVGHSDQTDLLTWVPIKNPPMADSCQQQFRVEVHVDALGTVQWVAFPEPSGLIRDYPPVRISMLFIRRSIGLWQFKPSNQTEMRTFTFDILVNGRRQASEVRGVRTSFQPPRTFITETIVPTVLLMDRVNGQPPKAACKKHRVPMDIELVPIHYGLPTFTPVSQRKSPAERNRKKYDRQMRRHFPNAPTSVGGLCIVGSEKKAEVFVCPVCRKNRLHFIEMHPELKP